MLKLYALLILMCIPIWSNAQCPTGTFTTQAQIDNFKTNYPNCSAPGKDLVFELYEDINNLDGLSHLTSIGGYIFLIRSPIMNLAGLSNLVSLGALWLADTPNIKNLADLGNLKSLGGLSIDESRLTSLAGLENLESLGGMTLRSNPLLSDLSALHHLPPPRGRVDLEYNPLLSDCNFEFICNGVRTPPGRLSAIVTMNGPGCNSVGEITANCGTLPVTLVSFKANMEGATSHLTWSTSSETNSSYFEIQRSQNGKNWSVIGKELAQGESKASFIYNFSDKAPQPGNNYYRLKMVDLDGTFAYSAIQEVYIKNITETIFPNPVEDKLYFQNLDEQLVEEVSIYNAAGKEVITSPYSNTGVAVNHLSAGIYIINVTRKDGGNTRYKFVKK
ncbi:T9SS type A sorting domain-containing protein [Dyadobacter sp. CY343]|uniref:T9SS type A sorting domain-containing protein n=1 Tax=Dyadobacter sp. CY343 TaxID=2907299 RepID=UPI001F467F66|nr:T9SS type A sorting domain-containing protein [Dyadobacter sp. CY343]MCE7060779.1 T9SS type A sorting domain-containing protein [Dyadobacter sp. CY343]